jgi:hypothetical protein
MKISKWNNEKEKDDDQKASSKIELNNNNQNDDDFSFVDYTFASSALANFALIISYHSLMNSVIYDSRCSQILIFDTNCFIDEIKSANNLIKISNNHMKIARYKTMLINTQLNEKNVSLRFYRTIYILTSTITLVFQSKLAQQRFDQDSYFKILNQLKTDKQICEIMRRYKILLLKFNLVIDNVKMLCQRSWATEIDSIVWWMMIDWIRKSKVSEAHLSNLANMNKCKREIKWMWKISFLIEYDRRCFINKDIIVS